MARLSQLPPEAQNFWKTNPIGARVFPESQRDLWRPNPKAHLDIDFQEAIRREHLTYLRLGTAFINVDQFGHHEAALAVARVLGYEFYVREANIEADEVSVTIANTGCAPFYYRWPMEIAFAENGEVIKVWRTDWDVRKVLPGAGSVRFSQRLGLHRIAHGKGEVLLRIVNPLPEGTSVAFANETQDSVAPGWVTLAAVSD
jgi:hypothetical protein